MMRLSMCLDPRRAWPDMARIARALDANAWHAAYVCDHFMPYSAAGETPPGDLLEAWTSLTAIAGVTSRVRVGTLVLGNAYRHATVVANMAATLDQVSGGRVVLGLGAGWQRNEHDAYGIELRPPQQRLAAFAEAVDVISSLLSQPSTTFQGDYYTLTNATCDPKPLQPQLPLLIGGGGEQRTMRIAARYADIWHSWEDVSEFARKNAVLDARCDEIGRDPASISRANGATVLLQSTPDSSMAEDADIVGNSEQVVDALLEFVAARTDEFIVRDHSGLCSASETIDIIEHLTADVLPEVS
jgi:F420-dependent oxidoreductase-like protein